MTRQWGQWRVRQEVRCALALSRPPCHTSCVDSNNHYVMIVILGYSPEIHLDFMMIALMPALWIDLILS